GAGRRSAPHGDVVRDVAGVPTATRQHVGAQRVLKRQPEEVQARLRVDDSAVVARLPVVVEDRQVDPAEVGPKAGAPEDVLDLDDLPALQERLSALDADAARKTLDSLLGQILLPPPAERLTSVAELRDLLAADED